MEEDHGEMINLVYNSEFAEVLEDHRRLIAKWAQETNDNQFPYYID